MIENHEIKLVEGYVDAHGVAHRRVVFGRRLTAKDLMRIDSDPQSQSPTQYTLLIARAAIVAFGDLPMTDGKGKRIAVALPFLLSLDAVDYEDLIAGHDEFLRLSRGDAIAEIISSSEIALGFGIERDGVIYDLVKFGRRLTAKDLVEADRMNLTGVARLVYEMSRQIEKITSSRHDLSLDAIDMDLLESLDIEDLNFLRGGLLLWRESFRFRGKSVPGTNGNRDVSADEGTSSVGIRNPELVN